MTKKMWLIAGCAAASLALIAIFSLRTSIDIKKADERAEAKKAAAETAEDAAAELEKRQSEHTAKIEYLETEIEKLRDEARRKDEELKRLGARVRIARDRVTDAKRTRSIDTNADELCRRLAEVGHGCER
ncbi:MAG: hypothetical protein KF756_01785 [Acidobacteria bacterium]|nr:hypothetical protein [Acidobacteriota bacterium]